MCFFLLERRYLQITFLFADTVSANNFLFADTLSANNLFLDGMLKLKEKSLHFS